MSDKEMNPVAEARRWHQELKLAKREDKDWITRSKKIVKRYRDDRTAGNAGAKRYNILWSNVQTVLPALYGRTPRAQVERRWKDKDPVSRTAATILERALQYEIDHYGDYDFAVKAAVTDRLLPGRGVAWVRFETKSVETVESPEMQMAEDASPEMQEGMNYGEPNVEMYAGQPEINVETTPVDYVFWEDFRCTPARTWDEVTWVARRVYMSKDAVIERFGEEFADVNLSHVPTGLDDMKSQGVSQGEIDRMKKAEIWEIWDKDEECVYWVAEGYDKLLDHKNDPYGLDGFWPCPKPLYATQTTDQLVPVPDYCLYQDQAEEIDKLTNRISLLVDAVKVVGVYDASQPSIQRMLTEGVDNTLIPVDSWAAFSEKGGIKGTVDFLPIQEVMQALNECYQAREAAKQVVYDVTGLSDIIRGSSVASETATAQQIKGQYASMRLKRMQHDVAVFSSELLRIKAQLMCDLYSPQNLIEMSGIMGTDDAQFAEQAVQLMKSEPVRSFRIEVASDSLVEMDEAGEKAARTEFLQAFGQAMGQALPIIQQAPEFAPLIGETLQFVVRTFKGGRQLENALEMAIEQGKQPKPEQPNPEMMKMQAEQQAQQVQMQATQQAEQMKMQMEQQKAALAQQVEQEKMQAQAMIEQAKTQAAGEIEQFKAQMAMQLEQMKQTAETERAMYKAQLDNDTKLQIAAMQAIATSQSAEVSKTQDNGPQITDAMNQLGGVASVLVDAVAMMNKPKRRVLERDENGRAIGAIEISE